MPTTTDEFVTAIHRSEVAANDHRFDAHARKMHRRSAAWLKRQMGAAPANMVVMS